MSRSFLFAVAASIAVVSLAPQAVRANIADAPPEASGAAVQAETALLVRAAAAAKKNDLKTALALSQAVVAAPAFAGLDPEQQHVALMLVGALRLQTGDAAGAIGFLKRSSAMDQADDTDWELRTQAGVALSDFDDAVQSLATLARRWPASLGDIDDADVFSVARQAGKLPDGDNRQFALRSALFEAHWKPTDPFNDASEIWRELARQLLARGQAPRAAEVAAAVSGPGVVLSMRIDRDFDALVQAAPERFDVDAARDRRIAELRAKVAAAPTSLDGVNILADMLVQSAHDEEALKLLDDALARAQPPGGAKSVYADAADKLIWTMNLRAWALKHLGRYDEAIAQMRKAAERPEDGSVNVSQTINLGDELVEAGRPLEALKAVAGITPRSVSAYGLMAAEEVRGIAWFQLHDDAALAKSLALAKAHADDAPDALLDITLLTGDQDAAAALIIGRLADPARRADALVILQDWRLPPGATAFVRDQDRRLKAVRDRPDVQAAIAKVGHIERFEAYQQSGV